MITMLKNRFVFIVPVTGFVVLVGLCPVFAQQRGNQNQQGASSGTFNQRSVLPQGATSGNGAPGSVDITAGTITGEERFLRENRAADEFVGGLRAEDIEFIGAVSVDPNEVKSSIEGPLVVEERQPANLLENAQTVQRATGMYSPRLVLSPQVEMAIGCDSLQLKQCRDAMALRSFDLSMQRLALTDPPGTTGSVEVLVEDGLARLRGTVPSERDRDLAELLVHLEPGIWRVQNDIVVQPPTPATDQQPSR